MRSRVSYQGRQQYSLNAMSSGAGMPYFTRSVIRGSKKTFKTKMLIFMPDVLFSKGKRL